MTKFTKAQKKKFVKLYYSGTPAVEICKKYQIPHSTFYYWVEQEPIQRTKRHALINSRDYVSLLSKYKKATTEINILQEFISQIHLNRDERYKITDALYGHYSLHTLCDALQINRATYYNHLKSLDKISAREEKHAFLLSKIKDIYDSSNGTYGSDRITKVLKRNGERIGRNTVRECMLEMGLETAKTLYTKQRKLQWRSRKEARFRSQRKATAANTVWVSDLTEFFIHGKKIYICVILDAFSSFVVGYGISLRGSTRLILRSLNMAIASRQYRPGMLYLHTDNGPQLTSYSTELFLMEHHIIHEYSHPGTPQDNPLMESFNGILKDELIYNIFSPIKSYRGLRDRLPGFMHKYNYERIGVDGLTPFEREANGKA